MVPMNQYCGPDHFSNIIECVFVEVLQSFSTVADVVVEQDVSASHFGGFLD